MFLYHAHNVLLDFTYSQFQIYHLCSCGLPPYPLKEWKNRHTTKYNRVLVLPPIACYCLLLPCINICYYYLLLDLLLPHGPSSIRFYPIMLPQNCTSTVLPQENSMAENQNLFGQNDIHSQLFIRIIESNYDTIAHS